jgi:hypothetical protein
LWSSAGHDAFVPGGRGGRGTLDESGEKRWGLDFSLTRLGFDPLLTSSNEGNSDIVYSNACMCSWRSVQYVGMKTMYIISVTWHGHLNRGRERQYGWIPVHVYIYAYMHASLTQRRPSIAAVTSISPHQTILRRRCSHRLARASLVPSLRYLSTSF